MGVRSYNTYRGEDELKVDVHETIVRIELHTEIVTDSLLCELIPFIVPGRVIALSFASSTLQSNSP